MLAQVQLLKKPVQHRVKSHCDKNVILSRNEGKTFFKVLQYRELHMAKGLTTIETAFMIQHNTDAVLIMNKKSRPEAHD